MKIFVCIKQVPNTTDVKIDPEKGILIRDNVQSILNPADKNAIELALKIKDLNSNVTVTTISMGPVQAQNILYESLGMGVDNAVLLSDKCFAGSDTYVTSHILATAIKKLGGADLILTGKQAIDGETAQVGPQLAQKLNLTFETSVNNGYMQDEYIIVNKENSEGETQLKIKTPCLLTINTHCNSPRNMTVYNIAKINEQNIQILNKEQLNLNEQECGLTASPTKVKESFILEKSKQCKFITENIEENILKIIQQN